MPYTDDNLNELFQRAAEDYPLNTDNSDWDSIAGRVGAPSAQLVTKKNNRNWKYVALLLLLLVGSLAVYKFQFSTQVDVNKNASLKNTDTKSKPKPTAYSNSSKPGNVQSPSEQQNDYNLKEFSSVTKAKTISLKNYHSTNNPEKSLTTELDLINEQPLNSNQTAENIASENIEQKTETNNPSDAKTNNAGKNQNQVKNKTNNKSSEALSQHINLKTPAYRFYGSLFASPDFATVKFQHIRKPGFKIGVSLGYRINNRFNIELGLQREKINFYSAGKYFNSDNIRLKPSTSIENLNGTSKTTSVPLSLRYNLSSKNNNQFFVTAGVNALVITHNEKYDYAVSRDGSEGSLSRKFSSATNPKYFTGVNVSAGYETKLSNWCNFKVEPYYQAPIRNFGVGGLPVSKFGINVGIVKNLK